MVNATIWKFAIKIMDEQSVVMPVGARILTAQMQGPLLCIWAVIGQTDFVKGRVIEVYGTGHALPVGERAYISTIQLDGGRLIFHVFERLN